MTAAFVRHGDLERAVVIFAGHVRLVKNGADYGITDDAWLFVVRNDSAVAVLNVSSRTLNGRLLETPAEKKAWHEDYERRYGYAGKPPWALRAVLDFCTSFPTSVGSVRQASKPRDCSLQKSGGHYGFGDSTCLGADPFILELDRLFMDGPPAWWLASHDEVRRVLMEHDLGVWPQLEAYFREKAKAASAAALALPVRCMHCDGTGVIPPMREE